jgi:hypothetical protein
VTTLRQSNVRVVDDALRAAPPFAPFAAGADRTAWDAIRERFGANQFDQLKAHAREDIERAVPELPASLYLEFSRSGRREGYEDAQRVRRNMLYRLTLAECLEWEGVYLEKLADILWARCEESNWSWPAHANGMDFPDRPTVDLAAAMTALDLAEIDYLIGDKLDPALRARIRYEVDRRCISQFLERHDHWWLHATPRRPINNWTAVCVAGIVGAACYLEPDAGRLAEIIARGMFPLVEYLETFDARGGSTEGPDYWSFGFGNYVIIAHLIEARTGGAIRIIDDEFVREIAQFPMRTALAHNQWVSFSDSDLNAQIHPGLVAYLGERLSLPELPRIEVKRELLLEFHNQMAWPLRQLAWALPEKREPFRPAPHDWFPEMAWMISRLHPEDPDALQLAVKGGHNAEMHNQNDIGALIVVTKGAAVVTDPGRGRYSRAYFGPERYSFITTSSLGHSVPVVNGMPQQEGSTFRAETMNYQRTDGGERLMLDMTRAYPSEAGLKSLTRSVQFDRIRPGGAVLLSDKFEFSEPGQFESVLITTGTATIGSGTVELAAGEGTLLVEFDRDSVVVLLDRHEGVEKQYAPSVDITRIIFQPRAQSRRGQIDLLIHPT